MAILSVQPNRIVLFCRQNRGLLIRVRDAVAELMSVIEPLRPKYYWIRERVHVKKYKDRVYRYVYVEVYDRTGTKYTVPKPILRIRSDDPHLEEKLLPYRAENTLHDLYLTLKRLDFNIDTLLSCYTDRR